MIEGIYISASGMLPKSSKHEAIANNLANIEVPGVGVVRKLMGESERL